MARRLLPLLLGLSVLVLALGALACDEDEDADLTDVTGTAGAARDRAGDVLDDVRDQILQGVTNIREEDIEDVDIRGDQVTVRTKLTDQSRAQEVCREVLNTPGVTARVGVVQDQLGTTLASCAES